MSVLVNPENQTLHPNPGEQCNVDDARKLGDPGQKPTAVPLSEALRLAMEEGYTFCKHCTDGA
jgi:hypothetical protein